MITRSSHSRSTTSSWCDEKSTAAPSDGAPLQHAGHDVHGERVEARERLVEDQHLGVVHECGGDLRALLVSEREGLDVVGEALAEPELLEQRGRAGLGIRSREPVEPREVDDLLEDLHLRVEPAFLGHVPESPAIGCRHLGAVERHRSGILRQHAEDDAHRRGLAGAVSADESGEAPWRTSNDTSSSAGLVP